MVLETFVGPRPAGMECCHANDTQSDNRLSNLRWDTHKENCRDRARNGCMDAHYQSIRKASPQEVQALRKQGLTFQKIADLLGVTASTAYRNSK
jgi:DNA-binding transcriptional regulator YiaG